jgi:copper(I)-binding protein
MNRSWRTRKIGTVLVALLAGLLVACQPQAPAGPKIQIENVWSRPAAAMEKAEPGEATQGGMAGMGNTGVVYLTLMNDGREADRLISAESDVAETVELHQTKMEGDVMKMQPIPEGVEVPAGGRVEFKPGSYHIMLIGLKRDLKVGDRFTMTLEFEKSGALTVESEVRQP